MKKAIIVISSLLIILMIFFLNYNNIRKLVYVRNYSEYVEKYAKEENIDPLLCYAIIKAESKTKPSKETTDYQNQIKEDNSNGIL